MLAPKEMPWRFLWRFVLFILGMTSGCCLWICSVSKYLLNFNNRMGTVFDTEKCVAVSKTSKTWFLRVRGEFVSPVAKQHVTDGMTRFLSSLRHSPAVRPWASYPTFHNQDNDVIRFLSQKEHHTAVPARDWWEGTGIMGTEEWALAGLWIGGLWSLSCAQDDGLERGCGSKRQHWWGMRPVWIGRKGRDGERELNVARVTRRMLVLFTKVGNLVRKRWPREEM